MSANEELPRCAICQHTYQRAQLTKHHLVPRSRKGKATVLVCSACHRQVHAVFTEKELARSCDTLDKLLAATELQPWIAWVRERKPRGRLSVRTSRRKSGH